MSYDGLPAGLKYGLSTINCITAASEHSVLTGKTKEQLLTALSTQVRGVDNVDVVAGYLEVEGGEHTGEVGAPEGGRTSPGSPRMGNPTQQCCVKPCQDHQSAGLTDSPALMPAR